MEEADFDFAGGSPRDRPSVPSASPWVASTRRAAALIAGIVSLGWIGCGAPPPPPVVLPPHTYPPVPPPAPTVKLEVAPKEALPSMHPCVPDFIVKDLHTCERGAGPTDYSAVANAMTAMTSAGPMGPPPKGQSPVQRPLAPLEAKAASTARAFLCAAPAGEPDDEHATAAFDLGRLYLHANHYEEAAVFLRDVAILDPQKHAEVEYAARFLLDSVRALAVSRPECGPTIEALTAAVEAHVCQGPGADQRAETCAAIARGKAGSPGAAP